MTQPFGFGFIGFDFYTEFWVLTGSGFSIKLHYGFGFESSGFSGFVFTTKIVEKAEF